MPYTIGDVTMMTTSSTHNLPGGGITDVLVGSQYLYILRGNMNTVNVYTKNLNGSPGQLVRTRNWVSDDSNVTYICTSNSSTPSCYDVFTEDGVDYLVGWSLANTLLYLWEIDSVEQYVTNRQIYYVCPVVGQYFGRGGWDGGQYVYFYQPRNNKIYRWDIKNKGAALQEMASVSGVHGLTSSYTGSGLHVTARGYYWGDGADDKSGLLGYFGTNGAFSGQYIQPGLASNFGATHISGRGNIRINPTQKGVAYYFGFTTVMYVIRVSHLKVDRPQINDTVHKENISLKFDITKDGETVGQGGQWCVQVNGVDVVPFPATNNYSVVPFTGLEATIPNDKLNIGDNVVTVLMKDQFSSIFKQEFNVTVTNDPPVVVTDVSSSTTHDDIVKINLLVTEGDGEELTYRFLLNGEVYSDWTPTTYVSPIEIKRAIKPSELATGLNTLSVEVQEHFKDAPVVTSTVTVEKTNSKPTLDLRMQGNTIYGMIDDVDGDLIQYRVTLNGTQVMPEKDYSVPFTVPYNIMYTIPLKLFKPNQSNTVTVECIDSTGEKSTWIFTGVLGHSGLMFKDPAGKFYTTEFGYLIKYLDLGVNYARQTSAVFEVAVENTLGYPVKNLRIDAEQIDLDPVNEKIEFSLVGDPFEAENSLLFPSTYDTGESQTFFVRLNCSPEAVGGGLFKIIASADAL